MKRILIILCALLVCAANVSAQDVITKKNGEDIKAKVLEIDNSNVKYKLFDEPNGVTYTMPKTQILMIRYESGRNEVFENPGVAERKVPDVVTGMKYRQLKKIYNYKDYEPGLIERHRKPVGCGVASFFIPGLGQFIEGEVGRGIAWLGGSILCSACAGTGLILLNSDLPDDSFFYQHDFEAVFILAGLVSGIVLEVCNVIDAVRIAKVQNLYYSDLRQQQLSLHLFPSVDYIRMANGVQPTAGLTLAMRF